jgi:colanic acid biosynthesis glycosyl transferase WcaI
MRLRLLVVSHYFWPEDFRINDLVAELVHRGHEVTVLAGVPNYPEGDAFPEFRQNPAKFGEYRGAEVVRVPVVTRGRGRIRLMLNYASYAMNAAVLGAWKLRGRKFDAIFVYEPSPITVGIPAVLLRRMKSVPVAFWVLDLWPETLSAVGVVKSRWVLRLVGKLVSFIYNRCDMILAQSRSFIPSIQRYTRHPESVAYFPSWADSVFAAPAIEPAAEVTPRAGVFNVMFAGNIGEAQDFPTVLEAATLLKARDNIRWLIVGEGSMAQWVRGEIARRGLEDRFIMLGRFPVERMPSFYRHAGALLASLKDEPIFAMTIPGKMQSYFAAGVPVIAMLNGEGATVVRDANAGLSCPAGDATALAAAVLQLASMDEKERSVMAQNALRLSATEFDRNTLITRLEQWLNGLKLRHVS